MSKNKNKIHLGIYGIFVQNNQVLVIKKNRGPYKGKYDLPGGRIEFGENIASALKREILEEVGSNLTTYQFSSSQEYFCKYLKNQIATEFHHIGLYYSINLDIKSIKKNPDGHDSDGACFVKISDLDKSNTGFIALKALKFHLKS